MQLSVFINSALVLTRSPSQTAGTIIVDGANHQYGDNPVHFAGGLVERGRASSVSIPGNTVAEFVAALVLLGVTVKGNILSAYAVSPRLGKGQGQLEQIRAALKSGPAMVQFVQRLCEGSKRPHIQVGDPELLPTIAQSGASSARNVFLSA